VWRRSKTGEPEPLWSGKRSKRETRAHICFKKELSVKRTFLKPRSGGRPSRRNEKKPETKRITQKDAWNTINHGTRLLIGEGQEPKSVRRKCEG